MAAPLDRIMWAVSRRLCRCFRQYETVALCSSSSAARGQEKDPLPIFARKDIQRILRRITGFDLNKVTAPKQVPHTKPRYKLMTQEELEELEKKAVRRAQYRLQMPPYMNVRKPITDILSKDPELEGLETSKLVFTDITFGVPDRTRLIVIRDPNGTLRKASWEERDKVNQIYNPSEGRLLVTPHMFEEQNLESLLKKKRYTYILDRACVQFEPDHPDYVRVTRRSYQHIDEQHDYDQLRSTRHFGPMAFHFVWNRQIDYLLVDMLQRELVQDATDLIGLHHTVHPNTASAKHCSEMENLSQIEIIKVFCEKEAKHKGQLELAIQGVELTMAAANN